MTAAQWKLQVLNSARRLAVPVMTQPGISLTGHTVREAVSSAEAHAAAVAAVAEHYPVAAATTIMDLSVEAEAFGAPVRFADDDVPTVIGRVVQDEASVRALRVPDPRRGRLASRLEAVRLSRSRVTDRPLLAGCIGPISLAARLFDVSEAMMALYDQPDVMLDLLEKSTTLLMKCCRDFKLA